MNETLTFPIWQEGTVITDANEEVLNTETFEEIEETEMDYDASSDFTLAQRAANGDLAAFE